MAFFVPFLGFTGSSILLNYHASQQLDNIGKDGRFSRIFWPPFGIGIILGLWVGVTFNCKILKTIEFVERWSCWIFGINRKVNIE